MNNNLYGFSNDHIDRVYTTTKSPFLNGYLRKSYDTAVENFQSEDGEGLDDLQSSSFSTTDSLFYWGGRGIRFLVNIPCAIADLALQIISCAILTVEAGIMKAERALRGCSVKEAYYDKPVTIFLCTVRYYITGASIDYLAQDLRLQKYDEQLDFKNAKCDLFLSYYHWLMC